MKNELADLLHLTKKRGQGRLLTYDIEEQARKLQATLEGCNPKL